AVLVLEHAPHTLRIVCGRRERIEVIVVLDADHERVEPPEGTPSVTHRLTRVERRLRARLGRRAGRAVNGHRVETALAARPLGLELRDERAERLDLAGGAFA